MFVGRHVGLSFMRRHNDSLTSTPDRSEISTGSETSLRTFRIEFDRPGATYVPGELVTGSVIVDLDREKNITALKLSIKGEAAVSWEKKKIVNDYQENTHSYYDHFRANEEYFHHNSYLLGSSSGPQVFLPKGFHTYPFQFTLPYNIPCSFEHANGYIRYTAKAFIDRPWKIDHEYKIVFTVVTSYDLNAYTHKCLGVDDELKENYSCFCCFDMGSIRAIVTVPSTGFVPGQTINTTVYINNNSSVVVTKVCVKLERTLEFHAKLPYSMTKTDKSIVKSDQKVGECTEVALRLLVPPLPPSELVYCSIIDQKYSLCVTIHVSGIYCSIVRNYPILIGTIPLNSTISSVPHTSQAISQPTAPMIDYDPSPPMPMSESTDTLRNLPHSPGASSISQGNLPPLAYDEYMQRANNIKDDDESNYVYGANTSFAPRYPVFNFSVSDSLT